uniref:Uncharacterized protein n=1 Tax=viral metagenome TaxID=1070528 RepID=A0A6C0LX43_9ZZZZ
MSIITNNGNIYIRGNIINNDDNGLENNGNIYLNSLTTFTSNRFKINSKILDIPLTLEEYNENINSIKNWIGKTPNVFGNIYHPDNLPDLCVKSGKITEDPDSSPPSLKVKCDIQNVGGIKTVGYTIDGITYDFYAIYEVSKDIVDNIEGINFQGPISYNHDGDTYWLKKYIRSTDTILNNMDNKYTFNNNGYEIKVDSSLEEGILSSPLLECSDKVSIELVYDKTKLKEFLGKNIGEETDFLFVADDPYYNKYGMTDEIIDTNILNNNNCYFFQITF